MRISYEEARNYEPCTIQEDYMSDENMYDEMLFDNDYTYEDNHNYGNYKREKTLMDYIPNYDPFDLSSTIPEDVLEEAQRNYLADEYKMTDDCPVHVFRYGDTLEIITSSNRADGKSFQHIKNLPGNKYMNMKTGQVHQKRKHKKRIVNQSAQELERLIKKHFVNSNGYFITLSYDYFMETNTRVKEDYTKFYDKLVGYYKRKFNLKLVYIRILETTEPLTPEENQDWHIHLFVKAQNGTDLKITKEQIQKMWGYENVFVSYVSKAVGLAENSNKLCNLLFDDKNRISIIDNNNLSKYYARKEKIYTCSEELEHPKKITMTAAEAQAIAADFKKTDDNISKYEMGDGKSRHVVNVVRYETYKKI